MRLLIVAVAMVAMPAVAFGDQAETLAKQAAITREQAEKDLAVQANTPDPVSAVRTALAASYAGLEFNVKTGKYAVKLAPGSSKAAATTAMGGTPATYPLVAHTLDELHAAVAVLEGELHPLIAEGKAMVVTDEKANKPRVYYATSLSSGAKTMLKTAVASRAGVATGTKTLAAAPDSCRIEYATDAYCDDRALGGVRINSKLWQDAEGHWMGYIACTAGFTVQTAIGPAILTAGHCEVDAPGSQWTPRAVWHCVTPPYGGCGPVAPWPASPGECRLWESVHEQDESGDFGLLTPDNCITEPLVSTWFGESETTAVVPFHPLRCMFGKPCSGTRPASAEAYVGEFVCHYGMNAGFEQEPADSNCGLVKFVDLAQPISYQTPPTVVHHVDLICAKSVPGDSGSPWVAAAGPERAIATGIEIAGSQAETAFCGKLGNAYADEIGVALNALGAHL